MQNRQKRLAALNGESRVFVCADCGQVKHVKDAGARMGRSADLVCVPCIARDMATYKIRKAALAFLRELPFRPRQVDMVLTMPGDIKQITVPFSVEA